MKTKDSAPIRLHSFIMQVVDAWNKDRADDPKAMPSAARVTKTIWDAEETSRMASVRDSANSLTIADVLEAQAKEYFGGHHWQEMEDYINRLSPEDAAGRGLRGRRRTRAPRGHDREGMAGTVRRKRHAGKGNPAPTLACHDGLISKYNGAMAATADAGMRRTRAATDGGAPGLSAHRAQLGTG